MSVPTYDTQYDSYLNDYTSLLNIRVEPNEAITALTGGVSTEAINPDQIPDRSIPASKMEWNLRGWTHTMTFSSTDYNTVAWGSGTLTLGDGVTSFSISASNTGNISAVTYIYFDINASKTALQTTTTATTAIGLGKVLIAVAENTTSGKDAIFQVFGGAGGQHPYLSTANQIAASIITANEMNVNSLAAITTTTGTLIIDASGYLRGGQTAYNTGTGFFLGYSTDAYKFSIGNPAGTYLTFDGISVTINALMPKVTSLSASDNLKTSADTERNTTAQGYTKVKEVYVGWGGVIRVKFDLKSSVLNYHANGQIYVNGVATGTARDTVETTYTTYSQDFNVQAGNLVQLYYKCLTAGNITYTENFRVYYDRATSDDVAVKLN